MDEQKAATIRRNLWRVLAPDNAIQQIRDEVAQAEHYADACAAEEDENERFYRGMVYGLEVAIRTVKDAGGADV